MFRLQLQLIQGTDDLISNLNNSNDNNNNKTAGQQMIVTPVQEDADTHQALT